MSAAESLAGTAGGFARAVGVMGGITAWHCQWLGAMSA